MKTKLLLWLSVLLCVTNASARDYLDTFNGCGWSPDGEWLAINPVNKNELLFISVRTGRSFMLQPLGDLNLDTRGVFASTAPKKGHADDPADLTQMVPSPGLGKLEMVEWSPNSRAAAYRVDRKTRAVFSLFDGAVTGRVSATESLPWQSPEDLRLAFELVTASKERAARYWLRVVRPDGQVVKEVSFDNAGEIRQVGLLRFGDAMFLAPDKQSVFYPRLTKKGWQLMQDRIAGQATSRMLTGPNAEPPLDWKLTGDSRFLAVAQDEQTLIVGELADWAKAQKVALPNMTPVMNWSPDGRFLACNDKQRLYLLIRDERRLVLISDSCSPQFWGWRGPRLYFGDGRTGPTNLYFVDTDKPDLKPQPILKSRNWNSAPREISLSPDGKTLVCLVFEMDSQGRSVPQLWKTAVQPDAQWQLMYSFRP